MLIRHSAVYIFAKLVPGLFGMATTMLLTRLLDPFSYGQYGLALVVMTFGSTMVFDWLGVSLTRFFESRRNDPLIVGTFIQIFLALLGLSALLTVLAWLCNLFVGRQAIIIATGILMMWAFSWFELMGRFEIANFRPARYLAMNLGRGLFIIVGAGTAAWTTHSPIWTAIGTAIGTGLAAVLGGFKRWKLGPAHFDRDLARQVLAFGLPLAVSMAVGGLVNSGTRALLEVLDSPQALGLYTASFLLVVSTINLVAGGIVVASYQLAVRAVESGDSEAARRQLVANGTLLMAVLAPAALGMALMAHGLAATMVGPQFVEPVAMLTPWMAASAFFGGLRAHYLDHAFQLGRRPALLVTVAAGAAVVGLGLGVVLIPRFGPLGAAIASAVAMAVSCVQGWLTGRAAFPLPLPLAGFARVLLACLVMAAVVLCIPDGGLASVAARVAAGALSYAGAAVALDVLGLRDGVWQALCRGTGVWRIRSLRQ